MTKPYGRKTKKLVGQILLEDDRQEALNALTAIPDKQMVGHLFSYFHNMDDLIKFRSIHAMGHLAERIEQKSPEKVRDILRRIMWNLNDESGGIGWGSAEAMGEILHHSPKMSQEFKSILFSYLTPGGTFIEHELLQRGVIWGIGTYLEAHPDELDINTEKLLMAHLNSPDAIKRAYAIRALTRIGRYDCNVVPETVLTDQTQVAIFSDWQLVTCAISQMASSCVDYRLLA